MQTVKHTKGYKNQTKKVIFDQKLMQAVLLQDHLGSKIRFFHGNNERRFWGKPDHFNTFRCLSVYQAQSFWYANRFTANLQVVTVTAFLDRTVPEQSRRQYMFVVGFTTRWYICYNVWLPIKCNCKSETLLSACLSKYTHWSIASWLSSIKVWIETHSNISGIISG